MQCDMPTRLGDGPEGGAELLNRCFPRQPLGLVRVAKGIVARRLADGQRRFGHIAGRAFSRFQALPGRLGQLAEAQRDHAIVAGDRMAAQR